VQRIIGVFENRRPAYRIKNGGFGNRRTWISPTRLSGAMNSKQAKHREESK